MIQDEMLAKQFRHLIIVDLMHTFLPTKLLPAHRLHTNIVRKLCFLAVRRQVSFTYEVHVSSNLSGGAGDRRKMT